MSEEKEVDVAYLVTHRSMNMPGGIIDYGYAEIVGFFDTFKEADECAKQTFKKYKDAPDLHITISKCLKTYCNGGIAISKEKD